MNTSFTRISNKFNVEHAVEERKKIIEFFSINNCNIGDAIYENKEIFKYSYSNIPNNLILNIKLLFDHLDSYLLGRCIVDIRRIKKGMESKNFDDLIKYNLKNIEDNVKAKLKLALKEEQ
jgi:hypothetical protein